MNSHTPDSLGRVPCDEKESVGLIYGGPYLHFLSLTLAYSSQIVLRTVSDSFAPQELISYDIPAQRALKKLAVLLRLLYLLVV